jgi:uncharacterized protein (TIGR00255 family)
MTGFGQATVSTDTAVVTVEVRSVNHRFADVRLRLPAALGAVESELRKRILDRVRRGRIDAVVEIAPPGGPGRPQLDRTLVEEVLAAARTLDAEFHVAGRPDVACLLAIPGLFKSAGPVTLDEPATRGALGRALDQALAALDAERLREGGHLAADLRDRLRVIAGKVAEITEGSAAAPAAVRERLLERLRALAPDVVLDPARLVQEAAFLADRADVTEELVRLRGHVEQARELLERPVAEGIGKRLEFLLQEILREANTVNAKSADLRTSRAAVDLKVEIEKVREQIQNVE